LLDGSFFGVETGNGRLLNLAGDRRSIGLMRLIHPAGHISADLHCLFDGRFGCHFISFCLQFIETPFKTPQLCPNR
jgi:hypothetical protein